MKYTSIISYLLLCSFHASQTMNTISVWEEKKQTPSWATQLCATGINTNSLSLVQMSIWLGADVNYNTNGTTFLHNACAKSQEDIIQELLRNPDINVAIPCIATGRASSKYIPLHIACQKNLPKIVDLLLQKNPETGHTPAKNGITPFDIALEKGNTECCQLILTKDPYFKKLSDDQQMAFLYKMINWGNKYCTEFLLNLNPKTINHQDNEGNAPLHMVGKAKYNTERHDLIKLLIVSGANATIKNYNQETPLLEIFNTTELFTFIKNNPGIIEELILTTDKDNNTQLHLCTNVQRRLDPYKLHEYLSFLKSHGVNIHARNKNNKTALDLTAQAYNKLYNEYMTTKLPYIKKALDLQEHTMNCFLRFYSPHTECALFKEILCNTDTYELPMTSDVKGYIVRLYYAVNIETIVAKKYINNNDYSNTFIENKNEIRQKLIQNPEPRLLWSTSKILIESLL